VRISKVADGIDCDGLMNDKYSEGTFKPIYKKTLTAGIIFILE